MGTWRAGVELGRGFSYVGKEYRLVAGGKEKNAVLARYALSGINLSLPHFLRMERNNASLFFNGDISKKIEITAGEHRFELEYKSESVVNFNPSPSSYSKSPRPIPTRPTS